MLVTGTQTFKLTRAETSNTLLLVPPEGTCVSAGPTSPVKRGVSCGVPGGGFEAVAAVGFQYEVGSHYSETFCALFMYVCVVMTSSDWALTCL